MNDFKIIKCKSCNAPLVEEAGKKLTQCIQCGYKFIQPKKPTSQTPLNVSPKKVREILTQQKKPVWVTILKWYFIIAFMTGILVAIFDK